MKYKLMSISGMGLSPEGDSYVVSILDEDNENIMGIVIKVHDAYSLAANLSDSDNLSSFGIDKNGIYDFLEEISDLSNIEYKKFEIQSIDSGIFNTYLYIDKDGEETRIKVDVGPGLILSAKYNLPIFTSIELLDKVGFNPRDLVDGEELEGIIDEGPESDLEFLNSELEKALSEENYELAAKIRDDIKNIDSSN